MSRIKTTIIILVTVILFFGTYSCTKKQEEGTIVIPSQFTCPNEGMSTSKNNKTYTLTNSQFIYFTYQVILNRAPDIDGFKGACIALSTGMSRAHWIQSVVNSPEFKQLLAHSQEKQSSTVTPAK